MGDVEWRERFAEAGLGSWRIRESTATVEVHCGSYAAAGRLVAQLAELCDAHDHQADVDLRAPDVVRVTTWSRDSGGLTDLDLRLALAVDRLLADLAPDPSAPDPSAG